MFGESQTPGIGIYNPYKSDFDKFRKNEAFDSRFQNIQTNDNYMNNSSKDFDNSQYYWIYIIYFIKTFAMNIMDKQFLVKKKFRKSGSKLNFYK